jgi:hypothetical protein
MRILVTVSPLMYREVVALSIHDHLVCRVRVRGAARVDATVEAGGAVSEVRGADLEDLFGALEGAEGLLAGEGGG